MTEHVRALPKGHTPHTATTHCTKCGSPVFKEQDRYGAYLHCPICGMYFDIGAPRTNTGMWLSEYNYAPLTVGGIRARISPRRLSAE